MSDGGREGTHGLESRHPTANIVCPSAAVGDGLILCGRVSGREEGRERIISLQMGDRFWRPACRSNQPGAWLCRGRFGM